MILILTRWYWKQTKISNRKNRENIFLENKIPDLTEFVKKTKLTELEKKIPDVSSLATKTALTAVENKIRYLLYVSSFVFIYSILFFVDFDKNLYL